MKKQSYHRYRKLRALALGATLLLAGVGIASCDQLSSSTGGEGASLMTLAALLNQEDLQAVSLSFTVADDNTVFSSSSEGGDSLLPLTTATSAFDCSSTMTVNGNTLTPLDLRFYVSDIKLIREDGSAVSVALNQDGKWQYSSAALLDFENASGTCNDTLSGGTLETNTVISGAAPSGSYTGVEFTLGLPEPLNKQSNATSPSPLNLSSLYWSWTGGFKFTKLEFFYGAAVDNIKTSIHTGSTGCTTYVEGTTEPVTCSNPFRATVRVTRSGGFDPSRHLVVLNLPALLNGYNPADATMSNRMCMPGGDKTSCQPILSNQGIDPTNGQATAGSNSFEIR